MSCCAMAAQISGTGSIQGLVSDSSGAILPGATVKAINVATGMASTPQTTDAGFYVISPLPAGEYLGRNIDFSKHSDREAIRHALIKHIRQTGGCDVNGKKPPRMLILKRLMVWFVEILFEAMLLGLALIGLFGYDQHAFGRSLGLYVSGILLLSFTTGYLVTTGIARGAWKGQRWWTYSAISVALFLVHSQIFFVVSGGSTRPEKLSIRIAGVCIVFVCTLAGTFALRKWAPVRNKLSEPSFDL